MKWLDIEQNTPVWEAARLGKITASHFGSVMAKASQGNNFGEVAKDYALQLALERINKCKSENDNFSNSHMKRGHIQEPRAIELYQQLTFTEVRNGGFFDCGDHGDSPDGLVSVEGTIEVKSVTRAVHYATYERGLADPVYYWQTVGHIDCSNREWNDFISYCADFPSNAQILVYRIYRENIEKDIQHLRDRREQFNEMVEKIRQQIMQI